MPRKKKDERADDELPQAYQLIQQSLFDDIVTTSPHQEFFGSIRCLFVDGVWYLSINDVMEVLLEGISKDPRAYWRQMRSRMKQQEGYQEQPGEFKFFPLPDSLNRIQKTECIRRESLFRIVQSIPSPKVENFKRFLAALGEQHMKEVERPELLIRRWINIYLNRGRTPEWIQARLKNDVIRNQLTTIWKERGADPKDYEYLTGTLHRLTFEMSVEAHRVFKSLQSGENLRDHMTELELAFSTLSETATGTLHEMNASHGFTKLAVDVHIAGEASGAARRAFEEHMRRAVVSPENFLEIEAQAKKRKKRRLHEPVEIPDLSAPVHPDVPEQLPSPQPRQSRRQKPKQQPQEPQP